MPFANSQGCRIYYRLEGSAQKPLLVLVHALGADHGMWDPQMPALLRYFQVLRLDLRGHGASDAPAGDYTIAQLAGDVLRDRYGRERFSYCGLSLGGMIGQWLGAIMRERIERLYWPTHRRASPIPACSKRDARPSCRKGMAAIETGSHGRFFSSRTLGKLAAESIRTALLATDPAGYAGCCAAIRDMDHRPLLTGDPGAHTRHRRRCRCLDALDGPWRCARIADPRRAHREDRGRAPFQSRTPVNVHHRACSSFCCRNLPPIALDAGFAVRRVRAWTMRTSIAPIANTTDFTREFQELITRYAWGTVWTRPGLDPRVRRLLVLAMTASLGRWEEFRLHVRTGFAAELETADLKEVLLQVAVYAGVPAANTGFHIAAEELSQ